MSSNRIYLSPPHLGSTEESFVADAFATNWIAPLGPNVNGFEDDIKKYVGIDNCVALNSGTAAIHLALINLGVQKGDEVLCSSFTFSASANPIVYLDAVPIFIDSEDATWNMCPELLLSAIKDRIDKGKKPKACVLVHLYGMPSRLKEIVKICKEYDIALIEDAAEAMGSTYNGQHLGTFGDIGIFSFNGNKIITTSGGGALVSHRKEYVDHSRFLSTQARDPAPHYQHSEIGYNYRLSNICAGIGRGQMEVLDQRVASRRSINSWYRNIFEKYDFISFHNEPSEIYFSNFWLSCILFDKTKADLKEELRLFLESKNIESRPLWKPMHLQPIFKAFPFYENGVGEDFFNRGLCLPSGSSLTSDQKRNINDSILEFFSNKI